MPSYDITQIAENVRATIPLCGSTRVITIDGPAGSGKSTLANALAHELDDCPVVHMDDLYEGWTQDLSTGLADRIQEWILEPISRGVDAQHLKYDWHAGKFSEKVTVPRSSFVILEGVGSGNSQFRRFVSLALWIESDPEVLVDRVVARDGEQLRSEILRWQVREAEYFELHNVKNSADIQLRGDG